MFRGKVAVVTGGGRGIGRAVCTALGRQQTAVVVADLNEAAAESVTAEIQADGGTASAVKVDVTDRQAVETLMERTVKAYAGLDILVNCAGIAQYVTFTDLRDDQWDRAVAVDMKGTFIPSQIAFEIMKNCGGGSIVNISSIAGEIGGIRQSAAYAAAKAGVAALTKSIAKAGAAYSIRCNAVSPGIIATDMIAEWSPEFRHKIAQEIPLKRLGTPEEVADVILFLAGPASRYVTGEIVRVNGGLLV